MRQKSKQLAKMEATQKLEQVKNEQRQQQLRLTGRLSPEGPALQQVAGGNTSPMQPTSGRQEDDVFLRPPAPPPSGFSSPLHQPPSSPQMFSPPSSRPSSPWDPYAKVAGTPRPLQQQQRLSFLTDTTGSPAMSPSSSHSGRPCSVSSSV